MQRLICKTLQIKHFFSHFVIILALYLRAMVVILFLKIRDVYLSSISNS